MALTLRAVAGLTTREIADAFLVPEATMAQRISRAKRTVRDRRLDQPGDVAVVLRVLYLVYTAGHVGRDDLAVEAIRLDPSTGAGEPEPEVRGLLALMLLHHARHRASDAARQARAARRAGPQPLDTATRSPRASRSCRARWPRARGASTRSRRPSRRCTTTPRRRTETDWPQILDVVRRAGRRSARIRCATTRPRC